MSAETSMVLSMKRPSRHPVLHWYAQDTKGLVTRFNEEMESLCKTLPALPSETADAAALEREAASGELNLEAPRADVLRWLENGLKTVQKRGEIMALVKRDWEAERYRLATAIEEREAMLRKLLVKGGFSADAAEPMGDSQYVVLMDEQQSLMAVNPDGPWNRMEDTEKLACDLRFIVVKWRASGVLVCPALRQAS